MNILSNTRLIKRTGAKFGRYSHDRDEAVRLYTVPVEDTTYVDSYMGCVSNKWACAGILDVLTSMRE